MHSPAQIGMNTEAEAQSARAEVEIQAGRSIGSGRPDRGDHFVERNGLRYAGNHLLIDLWDGEHFDDIGMIELALRRAVAAAGATLLHLHLHEFGAGGGVSGVAVLAESHISIHTWPERSYAASTCSCAAQPSRTRWCRPAPCVQGAPGRDLRADARRSLMTEWYEEDYQPHWRQRFEVERYVYRGRTDHQEAIIFDSPLLGRVLVLDGFVQTTERDEFIYHEMISHVAIMAHGRRARC